MENLSRNNRGYMGVIIAIIILIIVGFIFVLLLSGGTSIKDIIEHPNNYLNKEVTIIATYGYPYGCAIPGLDGGVISEITDEYTASLYIGIPEDLDASMLITWGKYKFTGIVKRGGFIDEFTDDIYLEVSKIEPV